MSLFAKRRIDNTTAKLAVESEECQQAKSEPSNPHNIIIIITKEARQLDVERTRKINLLINLNKI